MREPLIKDVAIVTPWYPTTQQPFAGSFVEAMVEATAPGCDRVSVYHCDGWGWGNPDQGRHSEITRAHQRLLPLAARPRPTVGGAQVTYVPAVYRHRRGPRHWGEQAMAHRDCLRAALGGRPIDAPVIHAHVGLRGGWVALENARADARVFVTEHATFVEKVLEDPQGRELYGEVLERCAGFFVVGEKVRQPIAQAFPQHADRIGIIPNAIAFGTPRTDPVTRLHRWLYVGLLIERKGVALLLDAFARCRAEEPELTLTVVGDGVLRDALQKQAAELGVSDAVTFTGAVTPAETQRLMREHDLLVHPSRLETFGMTVVEAIAAGLPVLVTRSGGPQEVLAGIEDVAGQLIDVNDDPETIAEGYRLLSARFPHSLDLPHARRHLKERCGHDAVARIHHALWFPDRPSAVPSHATLPGT
ncbi:glycosyltransferase [Streptomyces sporangiiformans]|nr:glycosyltransferase [Streptomyces sporangiiformans]